MWKKKNPFKFNKNSMVKYVRNMREDLNESAFTLIELIVVMAILAILVLLAAPQFLGYTSRANDAQIQNDTAVVESMVTEELVLDKLEFDSFGTPTLSQSKLDESKVYNKSGELVKTGITASDYKEVPPHLVDKSRTQLDEKGTFYTDKDGNVIFVIDGGSEDGQPNDGNEEIDGVTTNPSTEDDLLGAGYVLDESDFEVTHWVDGGEDYYDFKYIGTDTHIILPEYIDGIKVDNSQGMFEGNNTVQSVASTNNFILGMGGMFSGFEGSTLDLREFAHNINHSGEQGIIGYVGSMFRNANLDTLNMSGVDFTSMSIYDITSERSGIFAGANIETLIVGRYEDAQALNELLVWDYTNIGQVVYGDGIVYEPTYNDDDSMDEDDETIEFNIQSITLNSDESRFERGSYVPFIINHDPIEAHVYLHFQFENQYGDTIQADTYMYPEASGTSYAEIRLMDGDANFDEDSTYTLTSVHVMDDWGNWVNAYNSSDNPTFELFGWVDAVGPIISDVNISNTPVTGYAEFNLSIFDDSALDVININVENVDNPSIYNQLYWYMWDEDTLQVNDLGSGNYEVTAQGKLEYWDYEIDDYVDLPAGTYRITDISVTDALGNTGYTYSDLTFEVQ